MGKGGDATARRPGPAPTPPGALGGADFHWSEESEPHGIRRKQILAKHPEIRTLFGPDPMIAMQVGLGPLLGFRV